MLILLSLGAQNRLVCDGGGRASILENVPPLRCSHLHPHRRLQQCRIKGGQRQVCASQSTTVSLCSWSTPEQLPPWHQESPFLLLTLYADVEPCQEGNTPPACVAVQVALDQESPLLAELVVMEWALAAAAIVTALQGVQALAQDMVLAWVEDMVQALVEAALSPTASTFQPTRSSPCRT